MKKEVSYKAILHSKYDYSQTLEITGLSEQEVKKN